MMLLFTAIIAAIVGLHFFFAYREWRRCKGSEAATIDLEYVSIEDYLGRSFRSKVQHWIRGAEGSAMRSYGRNDPIRVANQEELPDHARSDEILVINGDFRCGSDASLTKEIYVHGDCTIGRGSRVRALAVDGDLRLESESTISRWVDCHGSIEFASGCKAAGRVTARGAVRLHEGAQAPSICAGEIAFESLESNLTSTEVCTDEHAFAFPPDADAAQDEGSFKKLGIDRNKLTQLSPDTWLYKGDLHPSAPLRLTSKLIVRGDCRCPAGSSVLDLKAAGRLEVGPYCQCRGALVSRHDLLVGAGAVIEASVFAGRTVHLADGVRAGRPDSPVVVSGVDGVIIEPNVRVHGKVCSAHRVLAAVKRADTVQSRTLGLETGAAHSASNRASATQA